MTVFKFYYEGLKGMPRLLARSSREPWIKPSWAIKRIFNLSVDHPVNQKLRSGMREAIRLTIRTMKPGQAIAVHYVRIGYDQNNMAANPIVVWIMVEKNSVPVSQAQCIVDEVHKNCRSFEVGYVQVEMFEGYRPQLDHAATDYALDIIDLEIYPRVGSSIAAARDHTEIKTGSGTLGGYVRIDGKVFGITSRHVIFGGETSKDSYPSQSYNNVKDKIVIMQPGDLRLEEAIEKKKSQIDGYEEAKSGQLENSLLAARRFELKQLQQWSLTKLAIGTVSRTSGARVNQNAAYEYPHRVDVAVIEVGNKERCTDNRMFLNLLPNLSNIVNTETPNYIKVAMKIGAETNAAGKLKTVRDFPRYLKRALTYEEYKNRIKEKEILGDPNAAEDGRSYVLWKVGQTTHATCGIANGIEIDYVWPDGKTISDEVMIKDIRGLGHFSKPGDSGALVFDADGYVVGQIWGGPPESEITYITPMDRVFEVICQMCSAKRVEMVVRPEDVTTQQFDKPKKHVNITI